MELFDFNDCNEKFVLQLATEGEGGNGGGVEHSSIGIMDGAYFVGRGEILHWINATLQLSLAKVEEVRPLSHPHFIWPRLLGSICQVKG